MIQLAGSAGEVDVDPEPTLQAISGDLPAVRTVCELAALAVPNLLQWQAMLPPNNPWSGAHSPALLTQVDLAGTSLIASVASLGQRTAQVARLWLADIDRRARSARAGAGRRGRRRCGGRGRRGAGHVHLLRGDWAAAPLSSPAVWNCSLQPVLGPDGSIGGLEDREGAVGLDLDAASTSWGRAAQLLPGPVWAAHLDLRRAWQSLASGDAPRAVVQAEAALAGYRSTGALAGIAVATTHVGLARLAAGRLPADTAAAAGTAALVRDRVGTATGLGLSQLCSRVSRLWRLSAVAGEPALAALDLSEALARPAGLTEHLTRCTIDRAQVLVSVGATRRARLLVEESIGALSGSASTGPESLTSEPAASEPTASEASALARSTEHGLLLLQLYQIAVVDCDGAQMRAVAQRFHSTPSVVAAFGAQLPAPGSDALALAYEAGRHAEEGDDRRAAAAARRGARPNHDPPPRCPRPRARGATRACPRGSSHVGGGPDAARGQHVRRPRGQSR